ncbi:hypothetical protein [Wolbachia endosymbiont of Dirofilaria (Dirofilaria) immitis]|uniref:hypothetical protein n=1 Tax=Wolbachia endosymbiont of Dirofilaria (Dirofilaria) immitis TaxID=1812115 RepID=UPI00158B2E66|nr:hypothetical protein [Wolbachia endosymbiont of Dirofilaria (Dirofilaria) immitis]QKX02009.1 hypothetical protein GOY12_00095 [Wolbachia endosymbiont of Dirofilaria (Dirofilaria) immitis]
MRRNVLIVNKNLISVELVNKQDLENFIKIFTVLNKHIAARTLFTEEVRIEYKQYNSIEVVNLLKSSGFMYHDVENILNHLSKHGVELPNSVVAYTLFSAYNSKLEAKDVAFSLFKNSPRFNIRVNKNIFIITPMNEENLKLNSQNSKMFIELLKSEKNMYDCVVGENTISVVVHSKIHQVINSIVRSLIKSCFLAQEEEVKLKERLKQLAFKDQAFVEYSSIKAINRYPHNHPLKRYKNITKDIENILYNFVINENSEFTVEQLNKLSLEVSPDTPRIITKTIDKLVKFH